MLLLSSADIKKKFRDTIGVSNSLDAHFVGPDLGPNCLQRLSEDDKNRC